MSKLILPPTGIRIPKLCPNCNEEFTRYLLIEKKRKHCPHCRVELHVCTGKHLRGLFLKADDDCANNLVTILEQHISKRNDLEFTFNRSERAKQVVHAYGLVKRAKDFIKAQKVDYGITPYDLVQDALKELLLKDFWQTTDDLLLVRNKIGPLAQQLYKERRNKLRARQNAEATFTDLGAYLALI